MNCARVILAAGEGRRIGGEKPRRLLAGRTSINGILERARPWSPAPCNRSFSECVYFPSGHSHPCGWPSRGADRRSRISAPLCSCASCQRVLTIPCDTPPMLAADLLDRLSPALVGYRAAMPTSAGRLHPTCALWRADAGDEVSGYVASGGGP